MAHVRRRIQGHLLTSALAVTLTAPAAHAAPARPRAADATSTSVATAIDWPRFLAQHDLLWKRAPAHWDEGAFLGNGLVGAMVFADGKQSLAWQLGRTDVTDRRDPDKFEPMLARPRLPIGRLRLETAGPLGQTQSRLSLHDAEWTARIITDGGSFGVKSYVHAEEPVLLIELDTSQLKPGAEPRFVFEPALPINERLLARQYPITEIDLNPAPFLLERGPVRVSVQRRRHGGEYAVAWQERSLPGGRRLLALSIADSHPDASAREQAAAAVTRALRTGAARLRRSHQAYWHAFYPASFVSVPDPRLESFYWLQLYKLASATRRGRPAIDTMGPWYDRTPWPGVWWNLNIQLTYWPVYAANHLELGESLLAIVDDNKQNLRANVQPQFRGATMAVGRMGGPDAISPVTYTGPRGPKNGAHELTNLIWVMHNYWLHWRHSMDPTLGRDRLYPLLKESVAYVLARLSAGPDGKLHLPEAVSPEFPKTAPDTNYDLSLLRWGCQTLLALAQRYGIQDPQSSRWQDTLARLTPYPVGQSGYLVGRGQPLDQSHRHFSHLMMVYPLHLESGEQPQGRALIERSLAHWIGFEGALQGYSFVGASAISSVLGKGEDAARYLGDLLGRFVHPNTMYTEAGPVIETPISAAQALHEMLLQSWRGRDGEKLRVFPAVPAAWKDAAFQLRAEGAFLVSAVRRDGRTTLVRVQSLAGEPTTLQADLADPVITASTPSARAEKLGERTWKLTLAAGESVLLRSRQATAADTIVAPTPRPTASHNPFGVGSGPRRELRAREMP